ncbi:MAG: UDP-galactopyranose mutase [Bacilli bacterium]|nr:UDP-galactopyranose mutase [Bacilli bacterium]
MHYDYLIVGSGLSGSTIANLLKNAGKKVLVLEKRDDVGGNISTAIQDGIIVHTYGPHIFHTSDKFAWDMFNKNVEVYPFINSPIANCHGEFYHMPFNMNTFHELWGVTTAEEAKAKIAEEVEKEHIDEPKNLEEQAIKLVGRTIYEKLIKGYTEKQWGRDCKELPASIIKRLPLRFEYNNNYFNDSWQGLPVGGYSKWVQNLLKEINVKTGVDYFEDKEKWDAMADHVIYTGRLDEYFSFKLGKLEYRSLRFDNQWMQMDRYQNNPVINFTTHDQPYTRCAEHKAFDPFCKNHHSTLVTFEYPDTFEEGKIPCYPINDEKNNNLAAAYKELSQKLEPKTFFLGRLAVYKYYDMDDCIIAAKEMFDKLKTLGIA